MDEKLTYEKYTGEYSAEYKKECRNEAIGLRKVDDIIDFTDAEPGYRDYGGSDSKLSLKKNGIHYMVKFAEKEIQISEIAMSESNSIFSEYIGSHIA